MENKQSPSKKRFISIQEEKLIREFNYDSIAETSSRQPKKLLLEILRKGSNLKHSAQKVLVSIKPRTPAAKTIKTLYIAEKNRFDNKRHFDKSGSRLAIGDHSSFTTHFSEDDSNTSNSVVCGAIKYKYRAKSEIIAEKSSTSTLLVESTTALSKCSNTDSSSQVTTYKPPTAEERSAEKCYIYTQPQITMTVPKFDKFTDNCSNSHPKKVDIGTLVVTDIFSDKLLASPESLIHIHKRIDQLERKILKQEMVFRSMDPNTRSIPSSNEEIECYIQQTSSNNGQPGCSYIEYSHIPETSAFQRYSQQPPPLSASKATTIQKEHNSEQYGRDFTLYDGITARGRRQCASVPCKRDDGPKMAAERVHKIRHKLNPVRDYRLMDTVHYLAQGEFAPRDDGIKLTPSREAVLSDIIYEDVCRTHWPNARLARRERCGTRSDLQRLIDSLLRERVAHVERRKRRHYRIVKLNHRHENCRPVGKTGDIIVASHKSRQDNEDIIASDHNNTKALLAERPRDYHTRRKTHRSYERVIIPDLRPEHQFKQEHCSPGPSYAAQHSTAKREPTCCYHTSSPMKPMNISKPESAIKNKKRNQDFTSESSITTSKIRSNNPRLVVKKNSSRKKYRNKEEPNLEHYILLPTLVVKTPSNIRRQKKFSELYHRILNVQLNKAHASVEEEPDDHNEFIRTKKNIGLNINVTLSNSEEEILNKQQ